MARSKVAGRAKIILSLDDRIASGLRRVQARMTAMAKPLLSIGRMAAGVGASLSGALLGASALFAKTGSEIFDMSKRTGMSAGTLGELGYAAKQNGSSLQAVEKASRAMSRTILDAGRGLSTATDNLDDLGISLQDLQGLSPEQQFQLFADRIGAISDPTRKAALAMKVFGKSGTELLPMLDNLKATREEARRLGLVMSTDDAEAADALGDAMDTAWGQLSRLVQTIGAAVAGPLTDFLVWSQDIVAAGIAWISSNKEIIQTVGAIAGGILAVGALFLGVGGALSLGAFAAGGFATVITAIGSVLSFVLSPLGLVIAGLTSLVTWFAVSTESGKAMTSNLMTWFGELGSTVSKTFGGIAKALSNGNIIAAGEVLWAGLKLLWQQGTHELENLWLGFKDVVLEVMTGIVFDVQALWVEMASTMKGVWAGLVTESKSIGEQIGHWLSRSSDPVLAAEQDAAHDNALANIQKEGRGEQNKIDSEKAGRLSEIEAARKIANEDRAKAFQSQLANTEKELAEAKANLATKLAAVDEQAASQPSKAKKAELAFAGLGSVGSASTKPQAILDASFAGQQFGGRSKELEILEDIRDNTKPKKFTVEGSIPGD